MKKRKKKIAIISRESNSKTLDIAMLEEELVRRGCDVTVLSRLLTKEKSVKALGYIGHVVRQEAAIMAADVVVLDTYCIPASMIPHRRGTKIVQMWHALGAIKKFGWQTVGKEGGSSEKVAKLMRMHRGYDYVISPSDITAEYFCEAFDTGRDKVAKYGLPRIDYIKSVVSGARHDDTAKKILTKYPRLKRGQGDGSLSPSERKTVLYAPTFRRGRSVDVQSLIDVLDPEKYDLVVKLHPLYSTGNADRSDVIYDETFSSYDWLAVADIIISDYSSFVIEAALADKPMFIYAYDLEYYDKNTGLNVDFCSEPIAPYVFEDASALKLCIDKTCGSSEEGGAACGRPGGDDEARKDDAYDFGALRAFRDRYIDIDTGAGDDGSGTADAAAENYCTAHLADFIESLCG